MPVLRIAACLILLLLVVSPALCLENPGTSGGATIGPEQIRQIVRDFLKSKADFLPQAKISFEPRDLPEPFLLPAGKMECEVIPADPQILRSRRFTLIFRVDGRVEANLAVRGEVSAMAPVVVAAGDLSRGTVITGRDLNVAEFDLSSLREPAFSAEELIGRRLKRSVRLGEPLDRGMVDFPPLVKRGELVTIAARKPGLLITARGLAREDGEAGGTIRVRNTSSQRDILCRVTGPGEVEVEF